MISNTPLELTDKEQRWDNNNTRYAIIFSRKLAVANCSRALNTSYLTDSYIGFTLKMESVFKKLHFWPKNDGEKWSRKNIFEIPPCERLLSLTS